MTDDRAAADGSISGLVVVAPNEIAPIVSRSAEGARVLRVGVAGRDTRAELFAALTAALPMDPPIASDRSWDALSDSLEGGLHVYPARDVLIVIDDATALARALPGEYAILREVLSDASDGADGGERRVRVVMGLEHSAQS
jgi:hypothetical protein